MNEYNDPWTRDSSRVLQEFNTDDREGLTGVEAAARKQKFGPNRNIKKRQVRFWAVFKEEVTEPLILLLLVIGVIYSFWGELRDAITIFAVIIMLVFSEVFTEYRAKKAVDSLNKLTPATARAIRDGMYLEVAIDDIVPGDIVILETGDRVPGDGRVIQSFGMEVDESALTGESMPVFKENKVLERGVPLAERVNMVYSGTTLTRGRGTAVIIATGLSTEVGKISGLVLEGKPPKTPLQLATKRLAGILLWVAVSFSVIIPLIGFIQGKPWKDMILTALSLSFASIPEELPIIITMVLGVGALALSQRNVLIRRLNAAETLGNVTVIATDKTGTLTENRMKLARISTDSVIREYNPGLLTVSDRFLIQISAMTTNVRKSDSGLYSGDPMEVAMAEAVEASGLRIADLLEGYVLKQEYGFDNQRKMTSAVYEKGSRLFVYSKGAPEVILARSTAVSHEGVVREINADESRNIMDHADAMAADAMRVIAFAYREMPSAQVLQQQEIENNLVLAGLVGFYDPPREGVVEALKVVGNAGIRTIIVSGDHPLTVKRIAAGVGLGDSGTVITGPEIEKMSELELREQLKSVSLFARINPEQKLRIVKTLQGSGEIVAVTGDGVNDAPALKSANIGIAMGETGTQVAREAADMILKDDSFNSISAGVREGRKIWDNLVKGISYYLSVKIALVLSFLVPLAMGITFPFAPIQIIVLELFMDLAASATFVAEPIEPGTMNRVHKRGEKFLGKPELINISLAGISLAAAILINYLMAIAGGASIMEAQTIAFATWLIGHIFLALAMRSQRDTIWKIGIFTNRVMIFWGVVVIVFLLLATNIPWAQGALKLTYLSPQNWLWVIIIPFITVFWQEIRKAIAGAVSKST